MFGLVRKVLGIQHQPTTNLEITSLDPIRLTEEEKAPVAEPITITEPQFDPIKLWEEDHILTNDLYMYCLGAPKDQANVWPVLDQFTKISEQINEFQEKTFDNLRSYLFDRSDSRKFKRQNQKVLATLRAWNANRTTVEIIDIDGTASITLGIIKQNDNFFVCLSMVHGTLSKILDLLQDASGDNLYFPNRTYLCDCPRCGDGCRVYITEEGYMCEKREATLYQVKAQGVLLPLMVCKRAIQKSEALQYFKEGRTGYLKGFVSRGNGKKFEGKLTINENGNHSFRFRSMNRQRSDE